MQYNDFVPVQHNDDDPFADSWEAQDAAAQRPASTRKRFGKGATSPLERLFGGRREQEGVTTPVGREYIDDDFGAGEPLTLDMRAIEAAQQEKYDRIDKAGKELRRILYGIVNPGHRMMGNQYSLEGQPLPHTMLEQAPGPRAAADNILRDRRIKLTSEQYVALTDALRAYEDAGGIL